MQFKKFTCAAFSEWVKFWNEVKLNSQLEENPNCHWNRISLKALAHMKLYYISYWTTNVKAPDAVFNTFPSTILCFGFHPKFSETLQRFKRKRVNKLLTTFPDYIFVKKLIEWFMGEGERIWIWVWIIDHNSLLFMSALNCNWSWSVTYLK